MPSPLSTLLSSIFLQYEHFQDANGTAANILEAHNNPGDTSRDKHTHEGLELLSQWWQTLAPPAHYKLKNHLLTIRDTERLDANNLPISELLRLISIVKDVLLRKIQVTPAKIPDLLRAFSACLVIITALDHLAKKHSKNIRVRRLHTELQKSLSALLVQDKAELQKILGALLVQDKPELQKTLGALLVQDKAELQKILSESLLNDIAELPKTLGKDLVNEKVALQKTLDALLVQDKAESLKILGQGLLNIKAELLEIFGESLLIDKLINKAELLKILGENLDKDSNDINILIEAVVAANHLKPIQKGDRHKEKPFEHGDLEKYNVPFALHRDAATRDLTAYTIEKFFDILQTYISTQHLPAFAPNRNIKINIKKALREQLQLPNENYNVKDALVGTALELPVISKPSDNLDLEAQIDLGNRAHAFVNVRKHLQNNTTGVDDDDEDRAIGINQGNNNSVVNRNNCFAISSVVVDRNASDIERLAFQRISYFGAKHIARLAAHPDITTAAELVEEMSTIVERVRHEVLTKIYRYIDTKSFAEKSRVSTCVTRLFAHAKNPAITIAVTANVGENMVIAWVPDQKKVIYLAKPITTTGQAQSLHTENDTNTLQISSEELPTHSIILQLSPDVWRVLNPTGKPIVNTKSKEWTVNENELLSLFDNIESQDMQDFVSVVSDRLLQEADLTSSPCYTINTRLAIIAPQQEQVLLDQFVQQQQQAESGIAQHNHPYQTLKHWASEPPTNKSLLADIATLDANRTFGDDKKLATLIENYIPKLNSWFGAGNARSTLENIYTSQGFYSAPLQAQIPHNIWSSVLVSEITRLVNNDARTLQSQDMRSIATLADDLFKQYWSAAEAEFCYNDPSVMQHFFHIDYSELAGQAEQHLFLKALCAYHRTLRQVAAAPRNSSNLYKALALQLKPLNTLAYPPAVLLCSEVDKLSGGLVYEGVSTTTRNKMLRSLIHSDLTPRNDGQYVWATGLVLLAQLTESETAQKEVFFLPQWRNSIAESFLRFKILFARQEDIIADLPAYHPDTRRLTEQSHAAIIHELAKLQKLLFKRDQPYFEFIKAPATAAGHFAHLFCNYAYAKQISITLALRAIELHDNLGWFVLAFVINHFYHEQQELFTVYQDIVTFLAALDGSTHTNAHNYFVRGLTYELLEADPKSALESFRVGAAKGSAEAMTRYAAVMRSETLQLPLHPQEQTTLIFENLNLARQKRYPLASLQMALFFQETPDKKLLAMCPPSSGLDHDERIQRLKLESGGDEVEHLRTAEYLCPVTYLRVEAEAKKQQDADDALAEQQAEPAADDRNNGSKISAKR